MHTFLYHCDAMCSNNWFMIATFSVSTLSSSECTPLHARRHAIACSHLWLAIQRNLQHSTFVEVIVIGVFYLHNRRVEISTHMKHQNYGLIFGVNTAVALLLQTVLTVILTDKRGLAAGARTQVSHLPWAPSNVQGHRGNTLSYSALSLKLMTL